MNTNCRENDLPGGHRAWAQPRTQKFHRAPANNGAGWCSECQAASLKRDTSQASAEVWRRKWNPLIKVALEKTGWVKRKCVCVYRQNFQSGCTNTATKCGQTQSAPAQHPGSLADVGMKNSSLSSVLSKSSAAAPHWFLCAGKVKSPPQGSELWPQQQSPNLGMLLKESASQVRAFLPTKHGWSTITRKKKTLKLQPQHSHVPPPHSWGWDWDWVCTPLL